MQTLKARFETWKNRRITRRYLLFAIGYSIVLFSLFGCNKPASEIQQQEQAAASNTKQTQPVKKVVRIVRSKQLTALAVLEKQGTLQKRLEPLGYRLEWPEFAAGPQQLEALNAGGLDIAFTAESPPIFSQAAGAPLVYLATTSANARSISLLVSVILLRVLKI